MITVYQIQLTSEQVDQVNAGETVPAFEVKMKMSMGFDNSKFNKSYLEYYTEACTINTDNLDEAFELTNLWDDSSKISRKTPMSSTSVGDIFVKDKDFYIVDTFGFVNVGRFEMEAA